MTDAEADVDTARLTSRLAADLDVEVTGTRLLADKLNLMIAISTAGAGHDYVLRRPNKPRRTDLFLDLKREYELLRRLQETPIPAPTPVHYWEDESIVGGPFAITTYLEGETVPAGSDLPDRFRTEPARARVADLLVDTLAGIHTSAVERFEDVCEQLTPREQVARATGRLDAASRVTGRELPTLRAVGEWLQEHGPTAPGTTLVHGDYRPSNVLFAQGDQPDVAGVLDWETAMLGDPLTELGYLLLRWRDPDDPTPSLDDLEARYADEGALRRVRAINETGFSPFTARPGSPNRSEVIARYETKAGIPFEGRRYYPAQAAFMLATVWADLDRHQIEAGGEAEREPFIDYLSMIAERIVSGELQL